MPKIEADSVQAHRDQMMAKLVDAAESILRTQGVSGLTAKAVTTQAGIARNSIYRYVDTIDALRLHVVARYLPAWLECVETAMSNQSTPLDRITAYVETNLTMAKRFGHGWLMGLTRGLAPEDLASIAGAHQSLGRLLGHECERLDLEGGQLTAAFIQGIMEVAFAQLDHGADEGLIRQRCLQAVNALLMLGSGQDT